MTPRARRSRILGTAVAASLVLAACSSGAEGTTTARTESGSWGATLARGTEPVRGGVLTVDVPTGTQGISPLFFNEQPSNNTIQVLMQVFDQLVTLEPGSIEPQPGLAESWEVADDGLTYTFALRDAQFSDGTPLTSADVKFSLESVAQSVFSDLFAAIESVETPTEKQVVLRLSTPSPGLIYTLAFPGASIVPSALIAQIGEDEYNKAPVGSGPFAVSSWIRDQSVVLERNENHWRDALPYLDRVELNVVPNDNTRVLNVRSGTSDVADSVPFSQVESINNSGAAEVLVGPGADMYVVALNNSKAPFDDPQVRRALALATPVDEIIDVVFAGNAPAMNTVTPKLKYWTDQAERIPHDIDAAKAALASSSVPGGFSAVVQISAEDQASSQTAQILQKSYEQLGVRLEITPIDNATYTERFQGGEYEMSITAPGRFTSDVPTDDQFATLLFDSPAINNLFTFFQDAELQQLTREAASTIDEAKRAALFEQIHIKAMERLPVIPLAYTPNRAAVGSSVDGFNYLLNGWWRLDRVWKAESGL